MKRYIVCLSVCLSTYTHPFNGPLSGTTRVSRYQKGKTNLDFTEARDSQWHWLGHMRVCTLLQTTMPAPHHPVFLQAGCPSCRPTNSIKALSVYLTCTENETRTAFPPSSAKMVAEIVHFFMRSCHCSCH